VASRSDDGPHRSSCGLSALVSRARGPGAAAPCCDAPRRPGATTPLGPDEASEQGERAGCAVGAAEQRHVGSVPGHRHGQRARRARRPGRDPRAIEASGEAGRGLRDGGASTCLRGRPGSEAARAVDGQGAGAGATCSTNMSSVAKSSPKREVAQVARARIPSSPSATVATLPRTERSSYPHRGLLCRQLTRRVAIMSPFGRSNSLMRRPL